MTVAKYVLEVRKSGAFVVAHLTNGSKVNSDGTRSADGNGVKIKTLESLRKHGKKLAKFHAVPFEELQL